MTHRASQPTQLSASHLHPNGFRLSSSARNHFRWPISDTESLRVHHNPVSGFGVSIFRVLFFIGSIPLFFFFNRSLCHWVSRVLRPTLCELKTLSPLSIDTKGLIQQGPRKRNYWAVLTVSLCSAGLRKHLTACGFQHSQYSVTRDISIANSQPTQDADTDIT